MSGVLPASGSPGLGPVLVLSVVTRQRVGFARGDRPCQPRWRGPGLWAHLGPGVAWDLPEFSQFLLRPSEPRGGQQGDHCGQPPWELRPAPPYSAQLRPTHLRHAPFGPTPLHPAQLGPSQPSSSQLRPTQLHHAPQTSSAPPNSAPPHPAPLRPAPPCSAHLCLV